VTLHQPDPLSARIENLLRRAELQQRTRRDREVANINADLAAVGAKLEALIQRLRGGGQQ
jgi:hypothetical protein